MRARRLSPSVALASLLLLAGCFDPKLEPGFECGADPPGPECPDGFYCDYVPYVCQREGVPPTPSGVSLGMMHPGPVAAHLGDDVVVAGWTYDPGTAGTSFQVCKFDRWGTPLIQPRTLDDFDDVDRASLRAVGSNGAVLIAGRKPGGRLQLAWVAGVDAGAETTDNVFDAFTLAGSNDLVCWAGARAPATGNSLINMGCNNGTSTGPIEIDAGFRGSIVSLAAGVTDVPSQGVVVAEVTSQVGALENDLFAYCPGHIPPESRFAFDLPQGDALQPQLFYSPDDSLLQVGWKASGGLRSVALRLSDCTVSGGGHSVGASVIAGFAMAGRARSSGWTGGAAVWSIGLVAAGGTHVSLGNWIGGSETLLDIGHTRLSSPHALTAQDNQLWFFLHAADEAPSQGYFKYTNLASLEQDPLYLDTAQVTPDFAVARRSGGGFFLVYREDFSGEGADRPLDATLALFDPDGDLEPPPE